MSQDKQSAIEAAAMAVANHLTVGWDGIHENKTHWRATHGMLEGIYSDVNGPFQDDCREAARAAILAYLSALAEDEGAVEACARAMATEDERDPDGPTYVIGAMMPDRPVWRDYEAFARAVLRTIAA
jgi:hypothetical protein